MSASYPTAVKSFSVKLDGAGNTIYAAHPNEIQDEIVAIETELIGAWTAYTPLWQSNTVNAHTLGNGTLTGAYKVVGKHMSFRIHLTFGTTTTVSSDGAFLFTIPPFSSASTKQVFPTLIYDLSDGQFVAISGHYDATRIAPYAASAKNGLFSTTPFTWADGDQVNIEGVMELA